MVWVDRDVWGDSFKRGIRGVGEGHKGEAMGGGVCWWCGEYLVGEGTSWKS